MAVCNQRPVRNQWEAINSLAADKERVLLVQRTGWGKSTVYFIATKLLREQGYGPTLIISPQLALMHNQVQDASEQLDLVRSDTLPPVASFTDGLVQDTVRVYGGSDPDIMTLQSDVPIPEDAFSDLSQCVLEELVEDFNRAIFLAGAPAQSEDQQGNVVGVATTNDLKTELEEADIALAEEDGAVSGVTGALINACYQADVPAALLLVRADPRLPDPAAARSAIENALEPLVKFEIDTSELQEKAEEIQRQKQQVAQQLQQAQGQQEEPVRGMFR